MSLAAFQTKSASEAPESTHEAYKPSIYDHLEKGASEAPQVETQKPSIYDHLEKEANLKNILGTAKGVINKVPGLGATGRVLKNNPIKSTAIGAGALGAVGGGAIGNHSGFNTGVDVGLHHAQGQQSSKSLWQRFIELFTGDRSDFNELGNVIKGAQRSEAIDAFNDSRKA